MKTILHAYCFDTRNPTAHIAWLTLQEFLQGQGLKCFKTWGSGKGHYAPFKGVSGVEVTLETEHLFNNQWNAAVPGLSDGYRIFDWAEDHPIDFNEKIHRGHYLIQTDEMREARRTRLACGYCGHQVTAETEDQRLLFCNKCTGSEYLKPNELHLLRMKSVSDQRPRAPLNADEQVVMERAYNKAQLAALKARGAKALAEETQRHESTLRKAADRLAGYRWLIERDIDLRNVFFYDSDGIFHIGMSEALSPEAASKWHATLAEFPFTYKTKVQS